MRTTDNTEMFHVLNTVLMKSIYKILIRTRGKNVKIYVWHFSDDSTIMFDWCETNDPTELPRFVPIEIRELSETTESKTVFNGEISYADVMNQFDHSI